MEKTGDPEYGSDILGTPVGDDLPLTGKKRFMFGKVIRDDLGCPVGHSELQSFLRLRNSHQTVDQILIGFCNVFRDRRRAEDSAANPGRRRGIQESGDQPPACHGRIGHDLIQDTGLNGEDRRQCRMRNILRIPSQTIHPDGVPAVAFEPDVDIGLTGIPACHNVEDAAFGRYHGEDSSVVCQKTGQRLAGTVIRKEADILHFLQIVEFTLQIEEFCFGFLIL